MSNEISLGASIDQFLTNLPSGSLSRAIGDNLYGINARFKNSPLPLSKDNYGYTFFTRPMLNLTDMNVSNARRFFSLLTANTWSYQRYTRMMLDPRLAYSGFRSPFVDPHNAFIPLLSNSLVSLSGWPDLTIATHTTQAGLYSEQHVHTDGVPNEYEAFDLSATFRNTRGSPVLYLLLIWVYYQTYVYQGLMNPHMDLLVENEMDYTTRIYRLVTDQDNRYVTNIAATGASFPISVPVGTIFDLNVDKPYLDSITDLNYIFKSVGFMFNEDIIKLEFNQTQALFNNEIAKILAHDMTSNKIDDVRRESQTKLYKLDNGNLTKVPHYLSSVTNQSLTNNLYQKLNYNMYPYINLETNELEWWVPSGQIS